MTAELLPLRVLLLSVSGWVHRQQQEVIDYLVEGNRVLREQIGGRDGCNNSAERKSSENVELGNRVWAHEAGFC